MQDGIVPDDEFNPLSKILDKVVASRLHGRIYDQHLSNDLQSVLNIHNDIVFNYMDNSQLTAFNSQLTAFTLLDLFAAFDTVNRDIHLS